MHIKKRGTFVFIGVYEVLDYLPIPITTYKPTRNAGVLSYSLELVFESVQVS